MADATVHSGIIYMGQPSSSGQLMGVSTGCTVFDENVSLSTAADSISNHGVTVCNTTHVRTLAAPYKGVRKQVIFIGTTKGAYLKAGGSATINNSTDDVVNVVLGTTKSKALGYTVNLVGASTSQWYMAGVAPTSAGKRITTVFLTSST